jgi:hypothetical protein
MSWTNGNWKSVPHRRCGAVGVNQPTEGRY